MPRPRVRSVSSLVCSAGRVSNLARVRIDSRTIYRAPMKNSRSGVGPRGTTVRPVCYLLLILRKARLWTTKLSTCADRSSLGERAPLDSLQNGRSRSKRLAYWRSIRYAYRNRFEPRVCLARRSGEEQGRPEVCRAPSARELRGLCSPQRPAVPAPAFERRGNLSSYHGVGAFLPDVTDMAARLGSCLGAQISQAYCITSEETSRTTSTRKSLTAATTAP